MFNFTGNGLTWREGTLDGGSVGIRNAGLIRTIAGGPFSGSKTLMGLLVNEGTLVHEGGYIYLRNATLRNAASGMLLLNAGVLEPASSSSTHRIENLGTLRKTTDSSPRVRVPLQNAGMIDCRQGTLTITRLTQTAGETRIHRGSTLSLSNPMEMQGGKLTGAGTFRGQLNAISDNNLDTPPATIAPGIDDPNEPNLNPLGILTIDGSLTMAQDAVLEVELAGTNNSDPANPQYDQVRITSSSGSARTVQLDGVLRLKGRDGYVPNVGDVYDVIVRTTGSWSRTGQFRQVEVDADTLPCVRVEVRYVTGRVQVAVVASGGTADINRDGCVDDSDLLAVLFAFGSEGNRSEDINCDGVVDDSDLLSVLFAFGQGC